MVRNSHEDAPSEEAFDKLVRGAGRLRSPFDAEATYLLYVLGRSGLRAGEAAHVKESWIDWDKSLIKIPSHDPCNCGYCSLRARKAVEHSSNGLDYETAMEARWEPKTEHGIRTVPFGYDPEMKAVFEAFFSDRDEYPRSRTSVNRRISRVAEEAGYAKRIYPHALRSHAASYDASKGVPAAALQAKFGWSDIQIARSYISLSGTQTTKALMEAHG